MNEDITQVKEKILLILRENGPSLPVHIAKKTELSILFASAFLSELLYEKKINISNMKIGNSPLYFLSGQEPQLERFAQYLKSKEKEAFFLLKEKKFLRDEEQQPAIRVALREIKDFAIPFKRNEEIYWRYFTVSESEFNKKEKIQKISKPLIIENLPEKTKEKLDIFDKKPQKQKKKPRRKGIRRNEQFFNKVKEFLSKKNLEIIDIQSFNKSDLIFKVRENQEEKLLIAYNKKRISTEDLIKAHKKSSEMDLPYIILSRGEPLKKIKDLISAIKKLSDIDKIE